MTKPPASPACPELPPPASVPIPTKGTLALPASFRLPAWLIRVVSLLLLLGSLASLPFWRDSIRIFLNSGTYSDVTRQWFCCLYVRNGLNPFAAANDALERTYGPVQGPDRIRLKDTRIWSVNMTEYDHNTPGLLPGTAPPEAGYPPSSLAICLALFGYLPPAALLPVWAVLNMACLLGLIWFLARPIRTAQRKPIMLSMIFTASIFLIWPPSRLVFAHGQFTFFSLLLALMGLHHRTTRPWLASLLFSLALIKPGLVLLFLIIPFVERNWRMFTGIALFHGFATLLIAGMVHTPPWTLISEWMNICRYLLQGSFTFQEIYNALGWENTPIATALTLGFFGYCTVVCWAARNKSSRWLLVFLCFANLMWTYHERHDFTLLVIPLGLAILQILETPPSWRTQLPRASWLGLFLLIGLGLSSTAYADLSSASRVMRWLGRLGLWTGVVWTNVVVWRQVLGSRKIIQPAS